jgi:hypothetical protein
VLVRRKFQCSAAATVSGYPVNALGDGLGRFGARSLMSNPNATESPSARYVKFESFPANSGKLTLRARIAICEGFGSIDQISIWDSSIVTRVRKSLLQEHNNTPRFVCTAFIAAPVVVRETVRRDVEFDTEGTARTGRGAGRIEGGPAQAFTIYTAAIEDAEEFGPECAPKPGIFLGGEKSAKLG